MAVQLVTKINRYIGTAAEIAAMTLTGIPAGSTFFESDTGILKILNAAGALVEAPSESVQLSGSNLTQAPKTGAKTVTSTAAELFAGSAALDGRNKLIVYNEGSGNVYWGNGSVTTITGFPLLPGDSIVFSFKPDIDTPIFFVAEADTLVRVGELA